MALLLNELLSNPAFLSIEKILKYNSYNHGVWFNKNKLMKQYKWTTSCKMGFTRKAKRTLISSAKKEDKEYIVCTLNCSNDFEFHKSLYEYYFNS
jgi:D-alanyl-D-alanine carboxypeptidase